MINEILEKQVTRKEFLAEAGLALFGLLFLPSIAKFIFKEEQSLKIHGNNILFKGNPIMEVTD